MTEEQNTYIKTWVANNIHIKEDRWLEIDLSDVYNDDTLWNIDEESYQIKKYLRNSIDYDELTSDEKALYDEALSLCSYIDELCRAWLYATPENWEAP
jgi:PAB1-binding protein PBP1